MSSAEAVAANLDLGRDGASQAARKAGKCAVNLTGADDLCELMRDLRRGAGLIDHTMNEMGPKGFMEVKTHLTAAEAAYAEALEGSDAQADILATLGTAGEQAEEGATMSAYWGRRMEKIRQALFTLAEDINEVRHGRAQLAQRYRNVTESAEQAIAADAAYRMQAAMPLPEGGV